MAIDFRGIDQDWNRLQIVDENPGRSWTDNDQLLVRQVVDQLTLALQNADLFQQTQRQNSDLAVLNEMGREIAAQFEIGKIADTIFRYTSQLMDTRNFFVALTDPVRGEISFPILYDEGQRIDVAPRKVGEGLSDWVIRNRKPLLLNGDVPAQIEALGLALLTVGTDRPPQSWLGVPLLIGTRVLGALVVQSTVTAYLYQERQRELLLAIAGQSAIALQNALLFQQTQQQTAELEVLNKLGRELTSLLSAEGVARTVYKYTGQLMSSEYFFFALYHPETDSISFPLNVFAGTEMPLEPETVGNGLTGYVIRNREPVLVTHDPLANLQQLGVEILTLGDDRPSESWLGVPVVLGQDVLGAIVVQSADIPFLYAERQRDLLAAIASQAAIALQNARLYREEQFRRQVADALSEMARIAGSTLQLHEVVKLLLQQLPRLLDFHTASIQLIEPDGRRRQIGGISLDEDRQHEIEAPSEFFLRPIEEDALMSVIYRTREPVIIPDTYVDPRWDVLPETAHIHSWLGAPLVVGQDVVGILILDDTRKGAYPADVVDVVRSFSAQAVVAIQNARLFDETQQRANELATLNQIVRSVSEQIALRQVLDAAYVQLKRLIKVDAFLVGLYDPQSATVSYPLIVDEGVYFPEESGPLNPESFTGKAILSGEVQVVNVSPEELATTSKVSGAIGNVDRASASLLYLPLKVGQETIGAMSVQSYDFKAYKDDDISLLENVANQLTVAIQNARLFEETQAKEENFRSLVENAPEAIVVIDTDGYVFAEPNTNAEQLFGLPKDELVRQTLIQMAPEQQPDGRPSVGVAGEKLAAALAGEVLSFEWDLKNAAGMVIPTEVRLARLPGTGNLVRATLTDITVRKASQQALSRQNEYLATAAEVGRLVTSTLDLQTLFSRAVELVRTSFSYYHAAIFLLDEPGVNAVLREATGEAGAEMKRRSHSLAVGSRSIIGQVTANGETMVVNDTASDTIFRPNPLLPETRAETGLPLRIGSRIIGAIDIQATEPGSFKSEDIAVLEILADQVAVAIENARSYDLSQRAVEELRELDKIKSQFLANMSHELRTPLNSIIGFSRVILKGIDGPINEQQQQDLAAIYNSGQHLLGLINDILDLAKIEAGKMELAFEEVNARDTIHGVMSTAMGLVKDKPIRLRDELQPDLPTIRADPMRLRQILINLLSNAAKFTEEGEIVVRAGLRTDAQGVEEAIISVEDSGNGISTDDQAKLFKAFSQVDTSPTRNTGGTGLGLSICQHLVGLHEGTIGVESEVGKGSTFYFTIPAFHQKASTPRGPSKKVVLCINDDSQAIKLYERYLVPGGYKVEALTDPEKAHRMAKKVKPFAITLDIMMPGFDGWQVVRDLKSDPETRDIPVIICSIVEDEEKGFSLGVAEYLLKPILEDDLIRVLNRLNGDGSISEVLVIDDDPDDLRLMEKILAERSQFKPVLMEGGEKGWEWLLAHQPQAVILDLFMPDLDGFSLLERLRSTPRLRDIPVLLLSGVDLNPQQKKQLANLGRRMLQKGMLDERELFSTLESALKRLQA
jgi:PAS domain S-box-containing protein